MLTFVSFIFKLFDDNKYKKMKTAIQTGITYEQILALVKQLPKQKKIELSKELEEEGINTKLSELLNAFRTSELSLKTIDEEVETVRQQIYDSRK
jgi:predicted DNA-binding protein YlxM (UPF0122 family)